MGSILKSVVQVETGVNTNDLYTFVLDNLVRGRWKSRQGMDRMSNLWRVNLVDYTSVESRRRRRKMLQTPPVNLLATVSACREVLNLTEGLNILLPKAKSTKVS